jgi:hypothetical protein
MFGGDDSFQRWMSAEVKAALMKELLPVLNEEPLTCRSRVAIPSAQISAEDYPTVDKDDAVRAAIAFAAGVDEAGDFLLEVVECFLVSSTCAVPNQGERSGVVARAPLHRHPLLRRITSAGKHHLNLHDLSEPG